LACIVFFSQYGNGANYYLWHARNFAEYLKAPTPEQVLIRAYGSEQGVRLYQLWQSCLVNYEVMEMTTRPDMAGLKPNERWFGL
ncbi:MAG TPA: hypothetical protein VL633_05255, partial [Bacteroidota bacterium]|nr:hypothetical protein [Bacteroidota bacterium]